MKKTFPESTLMFSELTNEINLFKNIICKIFFKLHHNRAFTFYMVFLISFTSRDNFKSFYFTLKLCRFN